MAKPQWMPPRLYQWVKPRSLGLHLVFVLIAAGCSLAAWWQVTRAMQGNTLSYLYSVEWPAFAVVAGIGWWQMFHDTPEDIARRHDYHRRMREASAAVVARTLPRSVRALTVESSEVAGRALGPAGAPAIGAGRSTAGMSGAGMPGAVGAHGTAGVAGMTGTAGAALTGAEAGGPGTSLVPTGALPDTVETDHLLAVEDLPDDELAEYNRYLATLAVHGKPKTWRNPRGL
ncbi:MAG TPA: hypothetical protein VG435_15120 [Acidimicrobiales bacterium]|jgi:hypothetical protein|nr:hypothetical protein [Acidimicrobiales bacterium]